MILVGNIAFLSVHLPLCILSVCHNFAWFLGRLLRPASAFLFVNLHTIIVMAVFHPALANTHWHTCTHTNWICMKLAGCPSLSLSLLHFVPSRVQNLIYTHPKVMQSFGMSIRERDELRQREGKPGKSGGKMGKMLGPKSTRNPAVFIHLPVHLYSSSAHSLPASPCSSCLVLSTKWRIFSCSSSHQSWMFIYLSLSTFPRFLCPCLPCASFFGN